MNNNNPIKKFSEKPYLTSQTKYTQMSDISSCCDCSRPIRYLPDSQIRMTNPTSMNSIPIFGKIPTWQRCKNSCEITYSSNRIINCMCRDIMCSRIRLILTARTLPLTPIIKKQHPSIHIEQRGEKGGNIRLQDQSIFQAC